MVVVVLARLWKTEEGSNESCLPVALLMIPCWIQSGEKIFLDVYITDWIVGKVLLASFDDQ